jgi:hypothetical protein
MPFDRVPVARILDNVLRERLPGYDLQVVEAGELGGAEAITHSVKPIIKFDQRVYDALYRDDPRPRMTGAHELGHLLMHTGQTGYAFMRRPDQLVNVERQADIFAEAFMMPECAFRQVRSIREAQKRFGVSRDAATFRARALQMWWLIRGDPAPSRPKRKGHSVSRTP